jgi:hypothetical protein
VLHLDVGASALRTLFPPESPGRSLSLEDADGRVDDDAYRLRWGSWAGRETAFFVASAELVASFDWSDVLRIGGARVAVQARLVEDAYSRLKSPSVPERLRLGSFEVIRMSLETTSLVSYSPYDPIDLPNDLVRALAEFDGAPAKSVLRRIARRHGLELDQDVVRRLVDLGILIDAARET